MIGCTTMERHIVAATMRSPLERLAGQPNEQWADVRAHDAIELDPRTLFLYVDISSGESLSDEMWSAIQHQLFRSAHAILYAMNFHLYPGEKDFPGFKELALFPLRLLGEHPATYVAFTLAPEGPSAPIVISTYSLRPVIVASAL